MSEELRKRVGQRIRELRRALHVTQEDLAAKADMSAKHLGEIERGKENLSLDYLARLAQSLKVEPFELLLSQRELRARDEARSKAVLRHLQRLDKDALSFLSDVAESYIAHRRENEREGQ